MKVSSKRKYTKINEEKTKLLQEVLADAKSIGLDFVNQSVFPIEMVVYECNTRALGTCTMRKVQCGYRFTICFSKKYERLHAQCAKNVLMHELIHTLKNCFNHGKIFKSYVRFINTNLPQYNVDTKCKDDEWERVKAIIQERIDDDYTSTKSGAYKEKLANAKPIENPQYVRQSIDDCLAMCFTSMGKPKKTVIMKIVRYQLDNNDILFSGYMAKNYPTIFQFILMDLPRKYLGKIRRTLNNVKKTA